jgi:transcriptional regulator with XRE-family HTH domain
MEFAKRLSELRRQRGISQKELGNMLGVSNKAVSKWENGESMPKTSTMLKLAELLGIDGNELIGFENKEIQSDKIVAEVGALKKENNALKRQLNLAKKKRKRVIITIICICIGCVIGAGVITFCFHGSSNVTNKNISDAGAKNTKIVFDSVEFSPADDYCTYCIKYHLDESLSGFDTKYSDYYNSTGEKSRALIYCSNNNDYVVLKVGSKKYFYCSNDYSKKIELTNSNVLNIELYEYSITYNSNTNFSYDDSYEYYYYESSDYYCDTVEGKNFINAFCNFYNNKPSPCDKKITENYLGSDSKMLAFTPNQENFNYGYADLQIGEFFKDDNSNVYFYDYVTTTSYPVEKEVSDYVYQ